MKILHWNDNTEIAADPGFVIIDQYGNRWRLNDGAEREGWALELSMVETSTGRIGGMSITPKASNVVEVGPS